VAKKEGGVAKEKGVGGKNEENSVEKCKVAGEKMYHLILGRVQVPRFKLH
jgi:hypothetical protein